MSPDAAGASPDSLPSAAHPKRRRSRQSTDGLDGPLPAFGRRCSLRVSRWPLLREHPECKRRRLNSRERCSCRRGFRGIGKFELPPWPVPISKRRCGDAPSLVAPRDQLVGHTGRAGPRLASPAHPERKRRESQAPVERRDSQEDQAVTATAARSARHPKM